ncbi:DUF262 domain-containing protein [Candidatus Haliotispira prima]|uniref:DUF262 domain-containing protein n=1 Tax=Candidatus Haliotispira prima TaxID=3034016 RepID=A0ABY8MEJ1_9SPIO|nr:DUF262 domain-containing protein [Candidatus Haliotispira prima]
MEEKDLKDNSLEDYSEEYQEEIIDNETDLEQEDQEDTGLTIYKIKSLPNDFNISTMINFVEEGIFEIPPFQRNYVWTKKQASSLIESLIMGLPVPQLFSFEQNERQLLIDGQQRLSSLYFFYKGRFPKKNQYGKIRILSKEKNHPFIHPHLLGDDKYFEDFTLQLTSRTANASKNVLHGKSYETLSDSHQRILKLRTLRTIFITQTTPEPEDAASSMYEVFHRLNTGGTNLKPQEVRQSIYYSDFYDLLSNLNKDRNWRTLLKKPSPDNNLKDIEYLLRCFALIYTDEYKPPMARFLNTFSLNAQKLGSKTPEECKRVLKEYEVVFKAFLDSFTALEDCDFLNTKKVFLITVLDAIFISWAKLYLKNKSKKLPISTKQFNEIKVNILEDQGKKNQPTTDKHQVAARIQIAKNIISKI